jgi:membrane protein implicated in regulation of membrane protease activity
MNLQHWHLWAIAGILLLILEMFTMSFYVCCFGLGAFAASAAAAWGMAGVGQMAAFAIGSGLALALIRPLLSQRIYRHSEDRPTNVSALSGQIGLVVDEIHDHEVPGRVKLGGEEWRAVSCDGSRLDPGRKVQVVSVDGATLTVKPA